MRFGISHGNLVGDGGAAVAGRLARLAEENGYDSVWASDHVTWPASFSSPYPYGALSEGMSMVPLSEALVWLSFVAAKSSTIRLGTGVLVAPQREPVLLAKQVATLDHLSSGRVELGMGVGWLREEFDILGAQWSRRGKVLEDWVHVLRSLWSEEVSNVDLESVSFRGATLIPKPAQSGGVPIIIGGAARAADRAGRLGDGYFAAPASALDRLSDLIATVRRSADRAGRNPNSIEVTVAANEPTLAVVESLASFGVDRVVISAISARHGINMSFERSINQAEDALGTFAAKVISSI